MRFKNVSLVIGCFILGFLNPALALEIPSGDKILVGDVDWNNTATDKIRAEAITSESSTINDLKDVDTIVDAPVKDEVLKWNGTKWVPAAYDYSFVFVFNTFTDDQTSPQLLGTNIWKAVGAITFGATYDNGPPDSMVVVVSGDFDNSGSSGWTANSLTFVPGTKTSQATLQATNYPDDPNDTITFTATADAEATKNTTVNFQNYTRWGTTSAAGTLSDANIQALANYDLINDTTQSFGTLNPGAGEFIALAYPDRLGTLGSTVFRHLGMTAGFALQDINPHVNSAGYSENYNVYKSTLSNMGSGTFQTTGTLLNQVRYKGVDIAAYDSAFITALTSTDIDDDSTQTATESGWSVVMGATNYSFIAVPSRWNLSTAQFRYLTDGVELQAAFTEEGSNIAWQNAAGYTENYDIFKSAIQNMNDGSIGVGNSAERLRYYWGYTTVSSGFDEAEVEAINNNTINQTNDETQTWGSFDPPASNYINLAISGDCTDLTVGTDYETDGSRGTSFLFDGLTAAINTKESVNVTNEFGYVQAYDVYGGTQANPGDGSGSLVTATATTTWNYLGYGKSTDTTADTDTINEIFGQAKEISNTRTGAPRFTVTAGVGEYIWYIYPKRLGTSVFIVGGFEGGFEAVQTVDFVNINGWGEQYYCYRSTNANLGVTAVTVQ